MNNNQNGAVLLWAALLLLFLWLALLFAGAISEEGDLLTTVSNFSIALANPFNLSWNEYSLKAILVTLVIYGFLVSLYYSEKGNYRPREEYGSAKWGNARSISRAMRTKKDDPYIILTKKLKISMNTKALPRLHQINANVLVIGGSGSGKSRSYIMPNLLEASCSYVVTDPKGER